MSRNPKRTRRPSEMVKWPVLLVKPHRTDFQTDERVNCWIMRSFQRGICEYFPIGSKYPEFGRNKGIENLLQEAINRKKSHIFFLDADTKPVNPYAIERLLSLDKDVVCGVTPIKVGDDKEFLLGWNVQKRIETADQKTGEKDFYHENYDIDELPKEPFKIDRVGGTTILIKRHVLEKLEKPYQMSEFNDDFTNTSLSEDYYFSQKLTEAGFDIWCDPTTICRHYHNVDLLDMMQVTGRLDA